MVNDCSMFCYCCSSDYDDSSDSESDDCELLSQSQASITSSTSDSVHSESCGGEVTSGGEPVEETDYDNPLKVLNKSATEQHPLVKKRDYWQPKNLTKSHKIKLQARVCVHVSMCACCKLLN